MFEENFVFLKLTVIRYELGTILENKVIEKIEISKNIKNWYYPYVSMFFKDC